MMPNLDELDRFHAAATQGPWICEGMSIYGPEHPESKHFNGRIFLGKIAEGSNRRHPNLDSGSAPDCPGGGKADVVCIVAAHNAMPELIARIRELEEKLEDEMPQIPENRCYCCTYIGSCHDVCDV